MSEVALQVILNRLLLEGEESGWIQLLVFAVVIALSGLASIVKARKQKRSFQEEEGPAANSVRRQAVTRPGQAPAVAGPLRSEQGDDAQREATGRPMPRTILRPRGALGAFVAEIKAEIKRAADEMQGRIPPEQRPVPAPEPNEPAKVLPPLVDTVPAQRLARAIPQEQVHYLSDIVPEFSGPNDLRRAILYYEILGKAVSLRGPADHLIEL